MSSEFFALTWRRRVLSAQPTTGTAVASKPRIAVAKKLLPRAVDRNLVKRIVREVCRDAPPFAGTVLIRLKKRPGSWLEASRRVRKRLVRGEVQAVLASARPATGNRQRP